MAEVDYTVTFLEMTAPPRSTPKPPRRLADAPTLALMRVNAPEPHFFLYLYRTVGAEYEWTDMLALPDEELSAFVRDEKVELYALYRGGAPAGFFQLDFRETGVCDLAYFGLFPEAVGQGLGAWFLGSAIQEAWSPVREPSIEKMTVNTCTLDHPSALATYQRSGFAPVRREEHRRTVSSC